MAGEEEGKGDLVQDTGQSSLQTCQPSWTGAEPQSVKSPVDETAVGTLLPLGKTHTGRDSFFMCFLTEPLPLVIGSWFFWSLEVSDVGGSIISCYEIPYFLTKRSGAGSRIPEKYQ